MRFGADTLRYYLMRAIAFGQDGDFNVKDLVARYNADLGNALGNLLNRVLKQVREARRRALARAGRARGARERALRRAVDRDQGRGRCIRRGAAASRARGHLAGDRRHQPIHRSSRAVGGAPSAATRSAPGPSSGLRSTVLEAVSTMIWPVMPKSADALRAQLGLPPVAPAVGASDGRSRSPQGKLAKRWASRRRSFHGSIPTEEKVLVAGLGLESLAVERQGSQGCGSGLGGARRRVPSPTMTSRKSISGWAWR